jgi:hypothetical protein
MKDKKCLDQPFRRMIESKPSRSHSYITTGAMDQMHLFLSDEIQLRSPSKGKGASGHREEPKE